MGGFGLFTCLNLDVPSFLVYPPFAIGLAHCDLFLYSVTKYADGSVNVSYSIGFVACILISDIVRQH
jgi:hypothetical protein